LRQPEHRRRQDRGEEDPGLVEQAEVERLRQEHGRDHRGREVEAGEGDRRDPRQAQAEAHAVRQDRDRDEVDDHVGGRGDRIVLAQRAVERDQQREHLDHADHDQADEAEQSPLAHGRATRGVPERGQQTADEQGDADDDRVLDVHDLADVEQPDGRPGDHRVAGAQTPGGGERAHREDEAGDGARCGADVERARHLRGPRPPVVRGEGEGARRAERADQVPGEEQTERAERAELGLRPADAADHERQRADHPERVGDEPRRGAEGPPVPLPERGQARRDVVVPGQARERSDVGSREDRDDDHHRDERDGEGELREPAQGALQHAHRFRRLGALGRLDGLRRGGLRGRFAHAEYFTERMLRNILGTRCSRAKWYPGSMRARRIGPEPGRSPSSCPAPGG
uniref:RNA polymerase beta subunit n=1 Tax=Caenorhabditis tropicalis TaxID=1561998 RepID=A0A1I7SY41_9PELO